MAATTRNKVIEGALKILSVLDAGSTLTGWALNDAATVLDDILTNFENEGVRFWARSEYRVALTASSTVTNGGKNYECIRGHTSGATTEPGAGGLSSFYWIEIPTAGAGAWTTATAYTSVSHITLPETIIGVGQIVYRDNSNQDDTPLPIIAANRYFEISDKVTPDSNTPIAAYMILGTFPIEFIIHPRPTNATDYALMLSVDTRLDALSGAAVSPDVQQNWNLALKYELASFLADHYAIPLDRANRITARAEQLKRKARGRDMRPVSCLRVRPAM